ncbi:hypothetical protein TrRE_jg10796 [Triparma retinervis]|uniref:Uncharacterized protein n=1 Tax=Triparma retinervis TaxID=2557542 RepID=A0A9W6ZID7_9STRA|nr:hypothetical protein TrRE_jg10796 [Triparma retinervis]
MQYTILLCLLVIAVATAFVPPTSMVAGQRATKPAFTTSANMIPVDAVQMSDAVSNAMLVASQNQTPTDFGGLLFPVGGLGLLAALILYLSPPLSD